MRSACTIFAFLTLNTPRSAHNKIFGAKFLSFEHLEITRLNTVCYAVFLTKFYEILRANKPFFAAIAPLLPSNSATFIMQ